MTEQSHSFNSTTIKMIVSQTFIIAGLYNLIYGLFLYGSGRKLITCEFHHSVTHLIVLNFLGYVMKYIIFK